MNKRTINVTEAHQIQPELFKSNNGEFAIDLALAIIQADSNDTLHIAETDKVGQTWAYTFDGNEWTINRLDMPMHTLVSMGTDDQTASLVQLIKQYRKCRQGDLTQPDIQAALAQEEYNFQLDPTWFDDDSPSLC